MVKLVKPLNTWMLLAVILLLGSCAQSAVSPASNAVAGSTPQQTGMPSIMELDALQGRAASAEGGSQTVHGSAFLEQRNGTVDGTSLFLDSNVHDGEQIAWGLYAFSGLQDANPHSLTVEATTHDHDTFYVGLSNHTHGHWHWFGPSHGPEFVIDLAGSHDRFINGDGNLFMVVVTHHGAAATHHQSTLTYGEDDHHSAPGMPYHLTASDGEFTDHVHLSWSGGDGATSYEVFRRPDTEHVDFVLVGTSDHNEFDDTTAEPGVIYIYKARSANENGYSDFSNQDHGFAGHHDGGEVDDCPSELTASDGTSEHGVQLDFHGNSDLHYNVFRAPHDGGDFVLIGTTNGLGYFDESAERGVVYLYFVQLGQHCHSNSDSGYRSDGHH